MFANLYKIRVWPSSYHLTRHFPPSPSLRSISQDQNSPSPHFFETPPPLLYTFVSLSSFPFAPYDSTTGQLYLTFIFGTRDHFCPLGLAMGTRLDEFMGRMVSPLGPRLASSWIRSFVGSLQVSLQRLRNALIGFPGYLNFEGCFVSCRFERLNFRGIGAACTQDSYLFYSTQNYRPDITYIAVLLSRV